MCGLLIENVTPYHQLASHTRAVDSIHKKPPVARVESAQQACLPACLPTYYSRTGSNPCHVMNGCFVDRAKAHRQN